MWCLVPIGMSSCLMPHAGKFSFRSVPKNAKFSSMLFTSRRLAIFRQDSKQRTRCANVNRSKLSQAKSKCVAARELWSKVVFGVRQGFEGGGGLAENVACLE
jgi:hypothetical protein